MVEFPHPSNRVGTTIFHPIATTMTDLDRTVGDFAIKRSRALRSMRLWPLAVMAAIVFVTYFFIVWTLRRGFDWTDESFVYTMIAGNRMTVGEPWGFQHMLHPVYVLTGESVLAFRILRLVSYILLSVVLVSFARAVARQIGISILRSGWVFILLFAQVGTFLAWSYPPRQIGYNELSSWFSQLGVALIVLSLAWGVSPQRTKVASRVLWSSWAGLGAILTLLLFAKVTSALAFGAILALTLVIPNPHLKLWKRIVSATAGGTAVLLVLWVCQYPIGFYLKNVQTLLFDKSARDAFGHPVSGMISTTADSLLFTGRALLPAVILFAFAMATFHPNLRSGNGSGRKKTAWITWIFGVLLLIALITLPKVDVWSYLGELVVFIGAAGIIGLAILGTNGATMHGSAVSRAFSVAIAGSAVLTAPFISAVGTSNRIAGQLVFAGTLWAVVLGIALVLLTQRARQLRSSARNLPALIGCVVLLIAALAVKTDIVRPYRTAPLLTQETSTSVPELRGILLTRNDAAWIDWIAAVGNSVGADHVPAIAINSSRRPHEFNSSGALYAFNHSGYANPWLGLKWPSAFNSLRLACTMDPPSDLFVLQPGNSVEGDPSTSGVEKSLAACGINFPGDFAVVDKRVAPDPAFTITIWRLKRQGLVAADQGPIR